MKHALTTFAAAMASFTAFGQIVVSDPAALTQSILNSSEQVAEQAATTEQVSLAFREARRIREIETSLQEALHRVSSAVASTRRIASSIEAVADMTRIYTSSIASARSSEWMTVEETECLAEAFMRLLRSGEGELTELRRVITGGTLAMNDAERIGLIDRISSRVERLHASTLHLGRGIEAVISARRYLDATSRRSYGYMKQY